jgi:hypothetical protein
MTAKIYQPSKSSTQSGNARTKFWILDLGNNAKKFIEPTSGWVGSMNTMSQVRLTFPTKEDAIEYANNHNITYNLVEPHKEKTPKKSYANNFIRKNS